MLMSRPTVNIEGLVGGYTGPGGKTILPHRAVGEKLILRLVPDMTAAGRSRIMKAHLAKQGYGDYRSQHDGRVRSNSTSPDAAIIRKELEVYRRAGIDPL